MRLAREQDLCTETVAAIEDCETHASVLLRRLRAASAVSYCRVAWPTVAHTTISKIWSSLRPHALAAAISSSVILWAVLGDLVDRRFQRLGKPCVVKRGAALGVRSTAVSFEDPRDQRFARLRDIRHADRAFLRDKTHMAILIKASGLRRRNGHEEERVAE